MADFAISGVWFSTTGGTKRITHVMLHMGKLPSIGRGVKTTEADVIKLIDSPGRNIVTTIKWDYSLAKWELGALVGVETVHGIKYLRSHKDATPTNNLDNLIDMSYFF